MNSKVMIAAIVSAVILFVWGFIFWGMLGGLGGVEMLENEDAITAVLSANITNAGWYFAPGMDGMGGSEEEQADWTERHKAGPLYMISYLPEGVEPMAAGQFIQGFLHFLVASLLICFLLNSVIVALPTATNRLMFVAVAGIFASVAIDFGYPIWWFTPWKTAFLGLIGHAVGWIFAGLAISRLIKPTSASN